MNTELSPTSGQGPSQSTGDFVSSLLKVARLLFKAALKLGGKIARWYTAKNTTKRLGLSAIAAVGAFFGNSMGIAAFGTAIAATIPLAIVFWLIGLLGWNAGAQWLKKMVKLITDRLNEYLQSPG